MTAPAPSTAPTDASAATASRPRHGYLFGQKIAASLSPLFHNTIYQELGLRWEQMRLESADIEEFLKLAQDPDFYGAAVTMPNKVAIMPFLDEVTEECRDVGACNTVFLREEEEGGAGGGGGRRVLCGTNTDVVGVREAFYQNVADPAAAFHGRPAMVVGGGGAARSAVYALWKWMRATTIYLVNRDAAEVAAVLADCRRQGYGDTLVHVATPEQAEALPAPGAVVSCVPDFPPRTDAERAARAVVEVFLGKPAAADEPEAEADAGPEEGGPKKKGAILEMCYNPSPYTAIGAIAERQGWQVILGTEAMIWQGLEQDRYWTGLDVKDLPAAKVSEVINRQVAQIAKL